MPTPTSKRHAFLKEAPVKKLVAALGVENCRFVGGVVRDTLLGRPMGDIDVATKHQPGKAMTLLEASDIKVIPTGLKHGTITAIAHGQSFEVTTLRADVKTHGRHADVAFHDDWEEDAKRRDFTINALYLSPEGEIFDYFGGAKDLGEGRVRFIGNAENRIREDALRILRFFRFHAWFGQGKPDADGLKACRKSVGLLDILSAERVRDELFKLLSANDPVPVILEMDDIGVFRHLFDNVAVNPAALEKLVATETALEKPFSLRRLSALLPLAAGVLAARLKLSKREAKRLAAMREPLLENLDDKKIRRIIYEDGLEVLEDRLFLQGGDTAKMKAALKTATAFKVPTFPVRGADLEKLGIKPGQEMGKTLEQLEKDWIDSDFKLSKQELLKNAA